MIVKLWGCVNVCKMCSSLLSFHTSKSHQISFSISLVINVYVSLIHIAKLIDYYLLTANNYRESFPLIIHT